MEVTHVPITWAYNHHCEAYLRNDNTEFYQVDPNTVDQEDLGHIITVRLNSSQFVRIQCEFIVFFRGKWWRI